MAGPETSKGRAPRLTFGDGLLTRALELIASRPHWQNALFPRHERASRWQIAQDVCVEVCIQEGCQEWIKDKAQRGLIAKDARGRFQSTKQWGYNPLDVKLRELREEHDRCYEDLVMDEAWRSWEDVPWEKSAKLRSRYPHHFTVHSLIYGTASSGNSAIETRAGSTRQSADHHVGRTPTTSAPSPKGSRMTPVPSAQSQQASRPAARYTPPIIKQEIIEIDDSPPKREKALPAAGISDNKRQRSPEEEEDDDDDDTSDSSSSYDDPEPPHFDPMPTRKAQTALMARNIVSKFPRQSAQPPPAGPSLGRGESETVLASTTRPKPKKRAAPSNGHLINATEENKASSPEPHPMQTVMKESAAVPAEELLRAARSREIQVLLAAMKPDAKAQYDQICPSKKDSLAVLFRGQLMAKALLCTTPFKWRPQIWRNHVFHVEDLVAFKSKKVVRKFYTILKWVGTNGGLVYDSFADFIACDPSRTRIVLTADEYHSELGDCVVQGYAVKRITFSQLVGRFEDRYREALRAESNANKSTVKRARLDESSGR